MSAAEKLEFVDLAIVVPLEEELLSVMEVFPSVENRSASTSYRHLVDVGVPDIKCLVVQQTKMGRTAANQAAIDILASYDVGLLVCLGIGGSLSGDMNLADVCYTGTLMDVYDNSKTGDAPNGGMTVKFSPVHFDTPLELTTAFNFIRTQPELQSTYKKWQSERAELAQSLISGTVPGRQNKPYKLGTPRTMCGTIVCGSVSNSQVYNDALAGIDRKILAIETESGGLFTAAKVSGIPVITIRAISDYADLTKSKLEHETAGIIRTLAAGNAATFLKIQLENNYVLSIIRRAKQQHRLPFPQNSQTLVGESPPLSHLIELIGSDVDQHLRELCPEYKLQSIGYKLPIPRARRRETSKAIDKKARSPAVEIRKVIETEKLVMLDLPRTYPDQALPWMIAHDLLTTEIAGRQVLPLVVNGDRLSPPRSGLSRISGHDIGELVRRPGVVPIIIVDDCPLLSKTKMKFLFAEVERYPDAHFIFIARGNASLIFSSDIAVQFKIELFDICEVSFSELTHFVERNFQLSGSEAEVIAYRLQETFNRYELPAHPSYLAAISNTTLAALINANRRSELIQLAVDAALSFVVADDTSDISLSRTTRARFLQKLVRAIRVDHLSFDEADLIRFTQTFAAEFDFDISAVAFIAAFVDQGIVHFDDGKVRVSLPYIESYLLARELLADIPSASRYFSLSSADFDYTTFDIYAELGPAEVIVQKVEYELERSLTALPSTDGHSHSVLGIRGTAGSGAATAKFSALYSQMQDAIDEVIDGKPASERKQQILDMRNDVRSIAAREARARSAAAPEQQDSNLQLLVSSVRGWSAGLILINSAAEHLRGETKQNIAAKIISLSSRILDFWTDINGKIDFNGIRQILTSDEHLSEMYERHGLNDNEQQKANFKTLMGNIVDLIEEGFITIPIRTVLGGVCYAHQRVLGRSLSRIHPVEIVEKLIHSVWLLETDPASGEEPACASVRELPRNPVLRGAVFHHLVATAYWNHSNSKDRKHIVAVANTSIQPFAQKVDSKLLRT